MHYVYILRDRNGKWYIGYTADLNRRVKQHPGYELIYYEAYDSKKQAVERERKLKYYGSAWRALRDRI